MEKSIESVWKSGFLHKEALIAPQVNNLYNSKSQHLVDKMLRMFRTNLNFVIGAAVLFLISGILGGVPVYGLITALLFGFLVFMGEREMKAIKKVDKGDSSYVYLKSFDRWLKNVLNMYANLYRYIYPLLIFTILVGLVNSIVGQQFLNKIFDGQTDLNLIMGTPDFIFYPIVGFAVLVGILAKPIYLFDIKLIFGPIFNKLDELIKDMEELSK